MIYPNRIANHCESDALEENIKKIDRIIDCVKNRGVPDPEIRVQSGAGYVLLDNSGTREQEDLLVCKVARELGIAWGCGGQARGEAYQQICLSFP